MDLVTFEFKMESSLWECFIWCFVSFSFYIILDKLKCAVMWYQMPYVVLGGSFLHTPLSSFSPSRLGVDLGPVEALNWYFLNLPGLIASGS
jgi:hypothetical protein